MNFKIPKPNSQPEDVKPVKRQLTQYELTQHNVSVGQATNLAVSELLHIETLSKERMARDAYEVLLAKQTTFYYKFLSRMREELKQ